MILPPFLFPFFPSIDRGLGKCIDSFASSDPNDILPFPLREGSQTEFLIIDPVSRTSFVNGVHIPCRLFELAEIRKLLFPSPLADGTPLSLPPPLCFFEDKFMRGPFFFPPADALLAVPPPPFYKLPSLHPNGTKGRNPFPPRLRFPPP